MKTEQQKMLAGELYDPMDPELVAARVNARDICQAPCLSRRTIVSRSCLFSDFADNAAWVACGKHALWNVPRHHAPGPDHHF
jgi:hypothetical protein